MTDVRQAKARRRHRKDEPSATPAVTGRLAQVRLRADEVEDLREAMRTLNIASTSEALREGLHLLAKEAAEVGAAEEIRDYYEGRSAPLPEGVVPPTDAELDAADDMRW